MKQILGVHVFPDLSIGTIGIKEGWLSAAAGDLKVEILGKKFEARVISESPYDPENKVLKS